MLSTDWARWSGRERVNVLRAILLNFNKYQLSIVSLKRQNIDIMVWIGREDQSTVYSCACLCLSLWLCRSSHTFSVNIISICYYYESFKYSNFIWFFDFLYHFFFHQNPQHSAKMDRLLTCNYHFIGFYWNALCVGMRGCLCNLQTQSYWK